VCTIAAIALAPQVWIAGRRNFAPGALRVRIRLQAARRKAVAARFTTRRVPRLSTLPPLVRLSGHKPSQEAKCFCLPLTHIQSHLRDHRLRNLDVDAVNLSQIYAGDTVQMPTQIKVRLARPRTFPTTSGFRYRIAGRINFGFHAVQIFVDSSVA
jgi:hypothetical protein